MFNIKNYSLGFDIYGLLLFLVIMLPNFVWFAVPAANDVLRTGSVTPHVDAIASVFQIMLVAALCIVINKHRRVPMRKAAFRGIAILIALYYLGWLLYYVGLISPVIIMGLCIANIFSTVTCINSIFSRFVHVFIYPVLLRKESQMPIKSIYGIVL